MIDLWLRIWQHVERIGKKNVTLRWVPSHQKWHKEETWSQRMDRRGNDQADGMAAKGRAQHEISDWLKGRLKAIEDCVTTYHRWTAFIAAAQHNGKMVPDHDKREKGDSTKCTTKKFKAQIANDCKVMTRIEYATNSKGLAMQHTVEEPPHRRDEVVKTTSAKARIARIRSKCGGAHQEALASDWPDIQIGRIGARNIDHSTYTTDIIPPEHTKGHTIWVAGNSERPWLWCTKCGAYTNKSVRNLNKQCKGSGCTFATMQLDEGFEPSKDQRTNAFTDNEDGKPDFSVIKHHFTCPASTDKQCRDLIWAIYCQLKQGSNPGTAKIWPTLLDSYNCRVVRGRKITQKLAQEALHRIRESLKELRYIRVVNSANRVPLATPPRRLTWEDTGQDRHVGRSDNHTGNVYGSQLCASLRSIGLSRIKDAFRLFVRQAHTMRGVRITRNALTNAAHHTSRRRRFCGMHSTRDAAIPQCDWPSPPPLTLDGSIILVGSPGVPFFVDANCMRRRWPLAQDTATNPTPPELDIDPFGHGGGID